MEEIFRISKDRERAKDLIEMAEERVEMLRLIPKDKAYKIVEEHYEIIKEMLTAIMYLDGYKTLSHIKLIEYFSENYKKLDSNQIRLIDTLRKYRNGIVYYGKKISRDFLRNNEDDIKEIAKTLFTLAKKKMKE